MALGQYVTVLQTPPWGLCFRIAVLTWLGVEYKLFLANFERGLSCHVNEDQNSIILASQVLEYPNV